VLHWIFLPFLILLIDAKRLQSYTVMCCTLSGANPIGARQRSALFSLFAALRQFFLTLRINWAQVVAKFFLQIQDGGPLK
jgi:hypothetical protein